MVGAVGISPLSRTRSSSQCSESSQHFSHSVPITVIHMIKVPCCVGLATANWLSQTGSSPNQA